MNVSLTNAGLYLEPRAYTDGSGANYGTPKFVSSATSLGGGNWSGIRFYQTNTTVYYASGGPSSYVYYKTNWSVESGVSSSSGGGVFTSESLNPISRKGKGGGLNVYEWFRHRAFLLYCNLLKFLDKSSYRSPKWGKSRFRLSSPFEWGSLRFILSYVRKFRVWIVGEFDFKERQSDMVFPTLLNPSFVKEVV